MAVKSIREIREEFKATYKEDTKEERTKSVSYTHLTLPTIA